jgi:hypothetical protein
MSLKKDVESIVQILKRKDQVDALVFIEIGIALAAFILDNANLLDGNEQLKWLLITLAVIPFLIFLYLTAKQILNRCNEISDLRFAKNELVDDFDDKVCYWVMTAVSFCDLLEEKEGANEQTSVDEIIPFLFQETNFYVNKSIEKFHEFQPAAKVIFKNGSGRSKQINSYRLETVVQILYQVRKRSYNVINRMEPHLSDSAKHTIIFQKSNDSEYNRVMENFLSEIRLAGISIGNVEWSFSQTIIGQSEYATDSTS